MNGRNEQSDRRLCERRPCSGDSQLTWVRENDAWNLAGSIHDISAGGLGFITSTENRPQVGEQIEVVTARRGQRMLCRVVRTSQMSGSLMLVGCQTASGGPTPVATAMPWDPPIAAVFGRRVREILTPAARITTQTYCKSDPEPVAN